MYSIGFVVTISVSLVILDFIAFPIELKIAFPSTVPSSVVTLDFPVTISKDIFCDGITAIILSILVIFIIAMICGVIWYFNNRNSNYKPNGKLNYDTVLVNEETNPYYQVGFADYVFIGKVDKEIERTFSDYGSARTIYEIEVTENLKGDLQNIIKVTYPGGYDKDGTLILHKGDYITDEELPKIGENYIFVGIGQPNGTILLQDLYSDTPYTEENKEKYLDYINNQENVDRERFKSIYEN